MKGGGSERSGLGEKRECGGEDVMFVAIVWGTWMWGLPVVKRDNVD